MAGLEAALAALISAAAAQAVETPAAVAEMETLGKYEFAYPYPSPDGREVAFQSNLDGRWQLYALTTADGSIRRLHTSTGDDRNPAWSPDGTQIAFVSTRDGNDEVYILGLATGTARSVAPHPGRDGHPKWSADGQWLVFNRTFDPADKEGTESGIVRVRSDGSALETLSDTPQIETFASFSPDGNSVVFVDWQADAEGRPDSNGDLVVLDLRTKARRNITRSFAFDGYPHWGASGEWIYFSSVATAPDGKREMALFRIHPDGTGVERLTPLDGVSEVRAIPASDEAAIYFNRDSDGRVLLYRMKLPPSPARPAATAPATPR